MIDALAKHELTASQISLIQDRFGRLVTDGRLSLGRRAPGLSSLPDQSGCYLWLVEQDQRQYCVYAGRTNSIRRRVTDYHAPFQMHSPNDYKIRLFEEVLRESLPSAALHLYFESISLENCPTREAELIRMFKPMINALPAPDEATRKAVEEVYRSHYRSAIRNQSPGT